MHSSDEIKEDLESTSQRENIFQLFYTQKQLVAQRHTFNLACLLLNKAVPVNFWNAVTQHATHACAEDSVISLILHCPGATTPRCPDVQRPSPDAIFRLWILHYYHNSTALISPTDRKGKEESTEFLCIAPANSTKKGCAFKQRASEFPLYTTWIITSGGCWGTDEISVLQSLSSALGKDVKKFPTL